MTQDITRSKDEKTKSERLYFDAYQISELYTLYDGYQKRGRMYDKWLLWTFIQKCFPKYTLADCKWVLEFANPLTPFIWIRRKDDPGK